MAFWHWHTWSKWAVVLNVDVVTHGAWFGKVDAEYPIDKVRKIVQRRRCASCGLEQHTVTELSI